MHVREGRGGRCVFLIKAHLCLQSTYFGAFHVASFRGVQLDPSGEPSSLEVGHKTDGEGGNAFQVVASFQGDQVS